MTESVWMGMACGTANAQSALPGELTAAWVRRLRKFLWTTRRR
jgi:hypothetical protein